MLRLLTAVLWAVVALPGGRAADAIPPTADAVTLPRFVVGESRAEAFFIHVHEGDVTRLWFVSLDRPAQTAKLPAAGAGVKQWGHLVAYRSHDVRSGDEILTIRGKPVAGMTTSEWGRALRSSSDEPPVEVEVRPAGAKGVRRASVVWQNSVTLGAKVPRAK